MEEIKTYSDLMQYLDTHFNEVEYVFEYDDWVVVRAKGEYYFMKLNLLQF